MKALIVTPGRFHSFALARELDARGELCRIVTGFPWAKVARERLPRAAVETKPLFQLASFGLGRLGLSNAYISQELGYRASSAVDRRALDLIGEADILVALSGSGTLSGRAMRARGKPFVCDRGSSHILYQQNLLIEEAERYRVPPTYFNPRVIDRELREYDIASAITVPSTFASRSFVSMGIATNKIFKIPYGVDLSKFTQTDNPASDQFEILFVGGLSLRKGIPYLIKAFERFKHPRKRLTLVGMRTAETNYFESQLGHQLIRVMGHVPNNKMKEVMSRSHVMVLPSIEDGFGLVMAEALACGCPVIATANTGAEDLFDHDKEGFIVPIRDSEAIQDKLEFLADNPTERQAMSVAAIAKMHACGGWMQYGDTYSSLLAQLIENN